MKKFTFFILFCWCVFGNAQVKRNQFGEKMVSLIEYFNEEEDKPRQTVTLKYEGTRLSEYYIKNKTEITTYKRQGQNIIWKKTVDGKLDRNYSYTYILNDFDKISYKEELCHGLDGSVLKFTYEYKYDDNKRIASIFERHFHKERGQTYIELSDRYIRKYDWVNGNLYDSGLNGYQWKIGQKYDIKIKYDNNKYDENVVNDINIDFFVLLFGGVRGTEWFPFRNRTLIRKYYGIVIDYLWEEDEYGDENLTEVHVYENKRHHYYVIHYVKE